MSFNNIIRFCCVECGSHHIREISPSEINKQNQDLSLMIKSTTENLQISDVYICDSCQTVYKSINNIPCFLSREDKKSDLFQRYFSNYEIIANDDINQDIISAAYKQAQTDKLIKYSGKNIHKKVLDLGVGKGYFLERIPHNNKMGVDISIDYLNILKNQGISSVIANAENLPFQEEFDLIVLSDILEHVFHPLKVLDCVYKALKPGGIAIIRVPYKEDLSQYSPEQGCKYEFVHLRSFDEESLLQMIQQSSLKFKTFHFDGFSYYKIRHHSKNSMIKLLINRIKEYFQNEIKKGRSWEDVDKIFHQLPNSIGCLLFEPIEMVAVVEK